MRGAILNWLNLFLKKNVSSVVFFDPDCVMSDFIIKSRALQKHSVVSPRSCVTKANILPPVTHLTANRFYATKGAIVLFFSDSTDITPSLFKHLKLMQNDFFLFCKLYVYKLSRKMLEQFFRKEA